MLDEILGDPTDLPVAEHATDTSGQTFAVFAACDLLGLRFSPRIRDLPSGRLYRFGPAKNLAAWPHAGRLLTQPIQTGLIASSWDELLRLAGSLKFGHATASLLLGRLQAGGRQNTLAKALVEYGRLVRTVFLLRYLADEELRRRIHRQLNKGENLHALRRRIFFAFEGHVRRRHHQEQTEQVALPHRRHQCRGRLQHRLPAGHEEQAKRRVDAQSVATMPLPTSHQRCSTTPLTAATPSTSNANSAAPVGDPSAPAAPPVNNGNGAVTQGTPLTSAARVPRRSACAELPGGPRFHRRPANRPPPGS